MRELSFLVTNDDGIESPLLAALVAALQPQGRVAVVAPRAEQSWISKAISRHRELTVRSREELFGCPAWDCDGTPADCVHLALGHLVEGRVDMVVSGVNVGSNVSLPLILASGTVGGALEGALHGHHALATSLRLTKEEFVRIKEQPPEISRALAATVALVARRSATLCAEIARRPAPRRFHVHNLNFPAAVTADTPIRRTVPANLRIGTLFNPTGANGVYGFTFAVGDERASAWLTDRACVEAGEASHSLLDFGRLGVVAGAHGRVARKLSRTIAP